jgi:hypothetical protein
VRWDYCPHSAICILLSGSNIGWIWYNLFITLDSSIYGYLN